MNSRSYIQGTILREPQLPWDLLDDDVLMSSYCYKRLLVTLGESKYTLHVRGT